MVKKYYCNRCGRELDFWDVQQNFTIDKVRIEYGSEYDGDSLHLRFCTKCMDELIKECRISPVRDYPNPSYSIDWDKQFSGMTEDD